MLEIVSRGVISAARSAGKNKDINVQEYPHANTWETNKPVKKHVLSNDNM